MPSDDFVLVQLTAAGIKLADGHVLGISSGRRRFEFQPGVPVRVERSYEWNVILRDYKTPDGELYCELAPTAPLKLVTPAAPEEENH